MVASKRMSNHVLAITRSKISARASTTLSFSVELGSSLPVALLSSPIKFVFIGVILAIGIAVLAATLL
jgi:hypothetical protein